jgi:hypothetical protein
MISFSSTIRSPQSLLLCLMVSVLGASAQPEPALTSTTERLPKARLWEPYRFSLAARGGVEPYHWRQVAGSLPDHFMLEPTGEIRGTAADRGDFEFTVSVADSSQPPKVQRRRLVLTIEEPLVADWEHPARVDGQRIQGSLKVSNRSGRDFDLTVIVLAVNEIGRATAIGYQRFKLEKDTRDFAIPFGDTVSPGRYTVHVDVVGEEPVSKHIFRARRVTGEEQVSAPL